MFDSRFRTHMEAQECIAKVYWWFVRQYTNNNTAMSVPCDVWISLRKCCIHSQCYHSTFHSDALRQVTLLIRLCLSPGIRLSSVCCSWSVPQAHQVTPWRIVTLILRKHRSKNNFAVKGRRSNPWIKVTNPTAFVDLVTPLLPRDTASIEREREHESR